MNTCAWWTRAAVVTCFTLSAARLAAAVPGTTDGRRVATGSVGGETGLGPEPVFSLVAPGADFVTAGTSTRVAGFTSQSEPFSLTMPAADGPITTTYLSWNYLLDGTAPPTDVITVNGVPVTGTLVGTGSPDLCWHKSGAASYLAVDPGAVLVPGANVIAGATDKSLGSDSAALGEGLTLVSIFTRGGPQRSIDVWAGYTSNQSSPIATGDLFFSNQYVGGGVHFFLNALDGQSARDDLFINGVLASGVLLGTGEAGDAWQGFLGPGSAGNLYDHVDDTLSEPFVSPPAEAINASTPYENDCIGFSLAATAFITCGPAATGEVCGNGIREGAEQCDDGNTSSCDGCSATCRDEGCGDGVLCTNQNELCDDGNTSDDDGCASDCRSTTDEYDLLLRHAPVLRYDADERFFPIPAGFLLSYSGNTLVREDSGSANALDATYADGAAASDDDAVNESSTSDCDYACASERIARCFGNVIYARARHGAAGDAWLQYWLYYYYDDDAGFGLRHEGDWETIQVHVPDPSADPDVVLYSNRDDGESCAWTNVERQGAAPVFYVAAGSHGLYRTVGVEASGETHRGNLSASGGALGLQLIDQAHPRWMRWPGHWGITEGLFGSDLGDSPQGPAFWNDGIAWNQPDDLDWASCE